MQNLAPPTGDRNPNSHTPEEVKSALNAASGFRRFSFRYELLDAGNVYVDDLDNVLSAKIEQNWLADVKRKATFQIRETGGIDFLSDRIKPYVRTWLPPFGANDFVEHPQGVFLLSSPTRNSDSVGRVTRDVEAYDQLQFFGDDLISLRYTAYASLKYTDIVSELLGNIPKRIEPSAKTIPVSLEWEPGTSFLRIINDLLNAINYESLSFDEDGAAVVRSYRDASTRTEEFEYGDGGFGLMVPEVDQELDLFSVPNKWVMVVSDPDRPSITSTYTNADPASPTSTIRRGRTIVDFREEQDAVDQATLDAKVARLAFEGSQIFEAIPFATGIMPIHSGNDVYRIRYGPLAINAKYTEQSWSMELRAGATMEHRARRVVTV